jgi:hypothetical protein
VLRETGAFGAILYGAMYLMRGSTVTVAGRMLMLAVLPYAMAVLIRLHFLHLPLGEIGQNYTGVLF